MDTKTYQYLLAIERTGSISQAARECYLSQPAISQQLHQVEEKLDVTIFQKEEGRLVPTPMGKIVLATATRILLVEEEMKREIEGIVKKG